MSHIPSLNVVLQQHTDTGARLVTEQHGELVWQAKSPFAARAMFYAMNSIASADSEMQMQRIMMAIENALLPPPAPRREPVVTQPVFDYRAFANRGI